MSCLIKSIPCYTHSYMYFASFFREHYWPFFFVILVHVMFPFSSTFKRVRSPGIAVLTPKRIISERFSVHFLALFVLIGGPSKRRNAFCQRIAILWSSGSYDMKCESAKDFVHFLPVAFFMARLLLLTTAVKFITALTFFTETYPR